MRKVFILILSIILTGIYSCEDNTNTDPGIIPPEDLLNAVYSDTTTIRAYTVYADTVRTDNARYAALGSYYDPVFGRTTASFFTTFNVSQSYQNFGTNPVFDSIVLILRFKGTYGDAKKLNGYQVAEVFEVTQDIPADSAGYNSFSSISYNPVPLATKGFVPIFTSFANEGTQLRIKLNNAFGQQFLNLDSLTANNVRSLIKGLHVRISTQTTASQAPGQGAIVFFDLLSEVSRLAVYFHNDQNPEGLELKMITTGSSNVRFNQFGHDYSSSAAVDLITQLNNPDDPTATRLFLQSGQGLRVKLEFPHILNYVANKKIIINKAELIVPADEITDYFIYPAPLNLVNYTLNSDGSYNLVDDFQFSYYDSFWDDINKQYRIRITQHIQQIIDGKYNVDALYLDTPILSKNTDVNRVIVFGPKHPLRPLKLHLVYTPVQTP